MSDDTASEPRRVRRGRSGTENRRKQRRVTFRLSPDEFEELNGLAEREGLTLASFARTRALTVTTTRTRRRPSVEVQAVTRLQGEMNRVGGNIHQILRRVNFGETPDGEALRDALKSYREVVAAIMTTLGRGNR
jgi:hypothetical protein